MRRANTMVGFSGLAHADRDNCLLDHSVTRDSDNSFIHNFDAMIQKAGGTIVARRWEGGKMIDGHTIYFVFAVN
jgi:hypothetical protein